MAINQGQARPPSTVELLRRRSEKIWLPAWQDASGNPIVNSADQPPIKEYYHPYAVNVWEFQAIKLGYNDAQNKLELNSINTDSNWRGYGKYQAWVSEIHSDGNEKFGAQQKEGEELIYVIRCIDRFGGWKFQIPDIGWNYKNGNDLERFENSQGFEMLGMLTGSGGESNNLLMKQFEINNEINFSSTLGF